MNRPQPATLWRSPLFVLLRFRRAIFRTLAPKDLG
jgi:hypothetical protein